MEEDGERVQLVTLFTRVLLHLADHPRISQETLARRMDVTMRTVQRHLMELEEEGYLLVDRNKKPFEYTIDWSKPCPHIPWLRLAALHPGVKGALHGLSEAASETYLKARAQGIDATAALQTLFSSTPETIAVR